MAEEVVVKKKRERIKRTAEKVELPASVASATTDTPLAETTQEPVKATKTRRKKVAEEVVPTTENVETTAAPTTAATTTAPTTVETKAEVDDNPNTGVVACTAAVVALAASGVVLVKSKRK